MENNDIGALAPLPHEKRLIEEEFDLNKKICDLYDFTQTDKFNKISNMQQRLLLIQLESMRSYWRCLAARLNEMRFDY